MVLTTLVGRADHRAVVVSLAPKVDREKSNSCEFPSYVFGIQDIVGRHAGHFSALTALTRSAVVGFGAAPVQALGSEHNQANQRME